MEGLSKGLEQVDRSFLLRVSRALWVSTCSYTTNLDVAESQNR